MRKHKLVALALAAVMMVGSTLPVSAAVNETQNAEEAGTQTTEVTYEQGSTFTVTIPKTIVLETTKSATYEVTVAGDLSSDDSVEVTPEASFTMSDQATTGTKKADVTATVEQDKTNWTYTELETKGNGTITADDLTAGTWAGTYDFTIELKEVQ